MTVPPASGDVLDLSHPSRLPTNEMDHAEVEIEVTASTAAARLETDQSVVQVLSTTAVFATLMHGNARDHSPHSRQPDPKEETAHTAEEVREETRQPHSTDHAEAPQEWREHHLLVEHQ